jgi:hypothetical protein
MKAGDHDFSRREQIEQGTGRRTSCLADIVAMAL